MTDTPLTPDSSPSEDKEHSIDHEEAESMLYFANGFLETYRKEQFVNNLTAQDRNAAFSAIQLMSYSSDEEVSGVRRDEEFQRVLELCRSAKAKGRLTPELRSFADKARFSLLLRLGRERHRVERAALAEFQPDVLAVLRKDPVKGLRLRKKLVPRVFEKKRHQNLKARHEKLSSCLRMANWILPKLTQDEAFQVEVKGHDTMEHLAYILLHLENAVGPMRELDPDWEGFPLKWYRYDLSLPELRQLLQAFRNGEDLSGYFVARYANGAERWVANVEAYKHVSVLRHRRATVLEAFRAFDRRLYSATVCIALPIIEGLLWDFATIIHHRYKDIRPTPEEAARVSQLLQSKRMSEEVDETFIRYFCDELYPHRNPVLHGRVPRPGCVHEAAKKLATLEYVMRRIEAWVTEGIYESFKNLPPDVFDRVFGRHIREEQGTQSNVAERMEEDR